jgi:hypothetical protein
MNIGICKFCGCQKPLVRAHIIPRALYPPDAQGNRMQFVLDGKGDLPPSRLPNGDYDPQQVRRGCEDLFNETDDYAKRFIVDRQGEAIRRSDRGTPYLEYAEVDYRKLKLFFISLLWRAHATSLRAYEQVALGKQYEATAKKMLKAGDPGSPDDFAVFIIKIARGPLDQMGASPTPRRLPPNNVRVYEFLLFGYLAYVKVDRQAYGHFFPRYNFHPVGLS